MKKSKLVRDRKARPSFVEPLEARLTPGSASFSPLSVASINREAPSTVDATTGSVTFKVTFSHGDNDPILGVDSEDFQVVTVGNVKAGGVNVTGTVDPKIYNVTVNGVQGEGYLGLNLVDDGSINTDGTESQLGGPGANNGSFTGQVYHVIQTGPKVNSIVRTGTDPTSNSSVSWTVTFSEPVNGVDSEDFQAFSEDTTASASVTGVTPINAEGGFATQYTVTVSGYVGAPGPNTGVVELRLQDDGTIRDADHNPLQTDPISFTSASTKGAGFAPVSLATGDINEDGNTDIVAADFQNSQVLVLLGDGQGGFTQQASVSVASNPRSVVLADFNGDGHLDMAVNHTTFSSPSFQSVTVLTGDGQGGFSNPQDTGGFQPQYYALAAADINKDGKMDLVESVFSSGAAFVNVLIGNGNGTFQGAAQHFIGGQDPRAIAVGDVDGDGNLDIVSADFGDNSVHVIRGFGNGSFSSPQAFVTGFAPEGVALGDVNGDGKLDVVTANNSDGTVSVLRNSSSSSGSVSFNAHQDYNTGFSSGSTTPIGLALADFDGDGKLDIVSTSGVFPGAVGALPEQLPSGNGNLSVLRNDSEGGFEAPYVIATNSFDTLAVAVADFNGDGKADIVVAGTNFFVPAIPPEQGGPQLEGPPPGAIDVFLNNGNGNVTGESYTISPASIDLTVTSVTDGKTSAAPGDLLTYTINYGNIGSIGVSSSVTLTVQLDPNLDFVAGENAGWTLNGSSLTNTIAGGLAAGASGNTQLKLHVKDVITGFSSTIGTTATISGSEDANAQNDSASDYDSFTGVITDLTVTSIEDPKIAVEGRTATFVIHYANIGNRSVTGAPLEITLPPGASVNTALSDPRFGSGTGSVTAYVDVPGNSGEQTITLVLNVGFTSGAAAITTLAEFNVDNDSNPANDGASAVTPLYHGYVVTAPGVAIAKKYAPSILRVFDQLNGKEVFTINAYGTYRDSIRVALGDFNNDGVDDIVTTTSKGTGKLRIFDGVTGDLLINEFAVFDGRHDKGAFVAVGDVNGFGKPEVIVGSALGGGKVRIYGFDVETALPEQGGPLLGTPQLLKQFTPFGAKFKGGIRVAAGDVDRFGFDDALPENGDKGGLEDDIVVGQGYYGGKVTVYNGNVVNSAAGQESNFRIGEIKVGSAKFRGGVSVALGDIDDDGHADIIVGRNTGRPSVVEVFDADSLSLDPSTARRFGPESNPTINPFDSNPLIPKNAFGVRVASADVNGDGVADIIASVGIKNKSLVKFYDGDDYAHGTLTEIMLQDPQDENNILRPLTAYSQFPNVALWIAGSSDSNRRK
jgi:uncharacterized repeat protein (TIGR01451 family)